MPNCHQPVKQKTFRSGAFPQQTTDEPVQQAGIGFRVPIDRCEATLNAMLLGEPVARRCLAANRIGEAISDSRPSGENAAVRHGKDFCPAERAAISHHIDEHFENFVHESLDGSAAIGR